MSTASEGSFLTTGPLGRSILINFLLQFKLFLVGREETQERGKPTLFSVILLVLSSLCSLHNRPINLRDKMLRQGVRLYLESQQTKKMAD